MSNIKAMVTSISAYIDIHEQGNLNKEQSEIVYNAREVILKSLEIIESGEKIDPKKLHKVETKLDKIFSEVITVFANTENSNPEILETKLNQEAEIKNKKKTVNGSSKERAKKIKALKKSPVQKATSQKPEQEPDQPKSKKIFSLLEALNKRQDILKEQIDLQNMAMIAAMQIVEDLNSNMNVLKEELDKLKKK
jgi:uncharacterized protein with NAD-binding domain and iron-sulfur cluster